MATGGDHVRRPSELGPVLAVPRGRRALGGAVSGRAVERVRADSRLGRAERVVRVVPQPGPDAVDPDADQRAAAVTTGRHPRAGRRDRAVRPHGHGPSHAPAAPRLATDDPPRQPRPPVHRVGPRAAAAGTHPRGGDRHVAGGPRHRHRPPAHRRPASADAGPQIAAFAAGRVQLTAVGGPFAYTARYTPNKSCARGLIFKFLLSLLKDVSVTNACYYIYIILYIVRHIVITRFNQYRYCTQ